MRTPTQVGQAQITNERTSTLLADFRARARIKRMRRVIFSLSLSLGVVLHFRLAEGTLENQYRETRKRRQGVDSNLSLYLCRLHRSITLIPTLSAIILLTLLTLFIYPRNSPFSRHYPLCVSTFRLLCAFV